MEQQFINGLLKLISAAGGNSLVRDLISETDENGDPRRWNTAEIEKAIRYVEWQTENFGTPEATAIIAALLKKYNLRAEDFQQHEDIIHGSAKVAGLQ
jgi:hypothetical protein